MSTPWNSRCAICIVRSVENPSLRLASCVQRRGGERRRRPLTSRLLLRRDVTVHGTLRAQRLDAARRVVGFVEQPHVRVLELARLRVEILAGRDALIADPDQRRDEFASLALQLRFEVPVDARCGTRAALPRARRSGAPPRSARGRR